MAPDPRVPGFGRSTLALLLALAACAPVALPPEADDPAVLAGQKAGIACSATHLSERALAAILVDELAGMTPAAYAIGDPVLDRASGSASVRYAADRPPRIAVHREGLGCTTLPPGATLADSGRRPGIAPAPPPGDASRIPWPDGDLLAAEDALLAPHAARLEPVLAAALADGRYGEGTKTIGVVGVHRGRLVGEGSLRVDDPAPIPEWRAPGIRARRSRSSTSST